MPILSPKPGEPIRSILSDDQLENAIEVGKIANELKFLADNLERVEEAATDVATFEGILSDMQSAESNTNTFADAAAASLTSTLASEESVNTMELSVQSMVSEVTAHKFDVGVLRDEVVTLKDDAATEAANAASSASASAASAFDSSTYANTSLVHSQSSESFSISASASASTATANASAASNSASSASSSASAAAVSEANAGVSAGAAADTAILVTDLRDETQVLRDEVVGVGGVVTGAVVDGGGWDASHGTYPSHDNNPTFWKVTTSGVVASIDYGVGDTLMYSHSLGEYYKIDNTESVSKVNGKTGVVQLTAADVSTYTSSEIDTALLSKSDNSHTHDDRYYTQAEVTGLLTKESISGLKVNDKPTFGGAALTSSLNIGGADELRAVNIKGSNLDCRLSLQGTSSEDKPGLEMTTDGNAFRTLIRHSDVTTGGAQLEFYTQADGTGAPTTKMVIKATQEVSFKSCKLIEVAEPTDAQDATTKSYVDNAVSTKSDIGHSHTISDVTDLQSELDSKVSGFDSGTNVAAGTGALESTGSNTTTTAVGYYAANRVSSGDHNTAIGHRTLDTFSQSYYNVAVGSGSLRNVSSGDSNVGVGNDTLRDTRSSSFRNVAIGHQAMHTSTGNDCVALGFRAGKYGSGDNRLYIANNEATNLISGDFSTGHVDIQTSLAIGGKAAATEEYVTTGLDSKVEGFVSSTNTAAGTGALTSLDSATQNTVMGYGAGTNLTTGSSNASLGYNALSTLSTGQENVAVGVQNMEGASAGDFNVSVGSYALSNPVNSPYRNVAIGHRSLEGSNGDACVAIGFHAGKGTTGHNRLYIANRDSATLISGNFSTGHVDIQTSLAIGGETAATENYVTSAIAAIPTYTPVSGTTTTEGTVRLATLAESLSTTDDTVALTPHGLQNRIATESRRGVIEIAAQGTVDAGVDEYRAVTPKTLKQRIQAINKGYVGQLFYFSTDTLPAGFPGFVCDGSTVVNGVNDFPELAASGSGWITVSGNDLIIHDSADFIRGKGSSSRSVGEYQDDAIRNITGSLATVSVQRTEGTDTGALAHGAVIHHSQTMNTASHSTRNLSEEIIFDTSRIVPTADENRPKSKTALIAIYHGVTV